MIPSWEGSFSLPSSCSFPLPPTLLPFPKHPNTHTHTQINLRFLSQTTEPALHWSYPYHFPAFHCFSFNQQILLAYPLFIHHVFGFSRFGVWTRFLGFRSTHLHPLSQDMLLSNGFAGVTEVRRWSSRSPPLPGRWRVLPTRQHAYRLNRRVEPPTSSSSTIRTYPRWFRPIPPLPIAGRPSLGGAWFSRAS